MKTIDEKIVSEIYNKLPIGFSVLDAYQAGVEYVEKIQGKQSFTMTSSWYDLRDGFDWVNYKEMTNDTYRFITLGIRTAMKNLEVLELKDVTFYCRNPYF